MFRARTVLLSVAWNHAGKILDFGLLFVARVLIARTLGPHLDSQFALFLNFATIMVVLTSFGTDWMVYKFVPRFSASGERDALAALLRRTFAARLVASASAALVLAPVLGVVAGSGGRWGTLSVYALPLGLYIVGQNLAMFGAATFTALLRTRVVSGVNVTIRALVTIVIAGCAATGALTVGTAAGTFAVAAAAAAMTYAVWMRPIAGGPRAPLPTRALATFSAVLLSHDLLYLVLGRQSDVLILSYWFPGDPRISVYDNAFQFGLVVEYAVTIGLGGVLFSTYARLASESRAVLGQVHQRVLQCLQLAFAPAAAAMVLLAPAVIHGAYGVAYAAAIPLVQAFLLIDLLDLALIGGGASAVLLNTIGRERFVLVNRLGWGALNLATNLYVIPHYGVLGAMIVSRGCSLCASATEYLMVARAVGGRFSVRTLATTALVTGAAIGAASLLPRDSLAECVLAGAVVVIIVVGGYALVKPQALVWAVRAMRSSIATSPESAGT